jgi:hypothetical protein
MKSVGLEFNPSEERPGFDRDPSCASAAASPSWLASMGSGLEPIAAMLATGRSDSGDSGYGFPDLMLARSPRFPKDR